ncbi:hypothetical protein TIFTF001_032612 [Ficus carica]|uniref:Uncharacterized protein n=1 Tax=Ficus carica TaxID=3494 RepID=A0AA88J6X5_FICCA|nr:hypothetical protein TIFTF001_032612 [Ficus carica]
MLGFGPQDRPCLFAFPLSLSALFTSNADDEASHFQWLYSGNSSIENGRRRFLCQAPTPAKPLPSSDVGDASGTNKCPNLSLGALQPQLRRLSLTFSVALFVSASNLNLSLPVSSSDIPFSNSISMVKLGMLIGVVGLQYYALQIKSVSFQHAEPSGNVVIFMLKAVISLHAVLVLEFVEWFPVLVGSFHKETRSICYKLCKEGVIRNETEYGL